MYELLVLHHELHGDVLVGDHGEPHQGKIFMNQFSLCPKKTSAKSKPKTNYWFSVKPKSSRKKRQTPALLCVSNSKVSWLFIYSKEIVGYVLRLHISDNSDFTLSTLSRTISQVRISCPYKLSCKFDEFSRHLSFRTNTNLDLPHTFCTLLDISCPFWGHFQPLYTGRVMASSLH